LFNMALASAAALRSQSHSRQRRAEQPAALDDETFQSWEAVGSGGGGGSSSSSSAVSFTSYEVSVVVVIKLIALPALHLLMASVLHPTDPASGLSRDQDPFHLVLLLQAAMPAAVSVQAIFHREGADTKPLGPLMLLQYALAMPTIVVAIVLASRT